MPRFQEPHDPLARWADGILRQLPTPPAPAGLAGRILQAVSSRPALPWYRRPWPDWPTGIRLAAGVASAAAFAVLWWLLLPEAEEATRSAARAATSQMEALGPWSTMLDMARSVANALLLVLRGLNPWMLALGAGVLALLWSTTLGLGTACWRLATGPSRHP